jgi:hypothetical protein
VTLLGTVLAGAGGLGAPTRLLAHAGPGATWQALVTAVAIGLVLIAVLTIAGRLRLDSFDDLVLPLAAVAILSSLAPLTDHWLSDWIGWSLPLGVIVLVSLLLALTTPLELTPLSPLTIGTAGLAAVAIVVLHGPLTIALHPPPDFLPLATDAELRVLIPEDGASIEAGTVEVSVAVVGGSIGPGGVDPAELPADPEEAGDLTVFLDDERVEVDYLEDCTVADPCTTVTFPLEVDAGERRLSVEFTRGDGTPLAPFVADRVTFEAS